MLVHLCDTFDIVSHFFDNFWRGDNTNTLSQTAEPSIELRACLNDCGEGEVLFVLISQYSILAEAIQNHIRQIVGEPQFDRLFFAGEHTKHPQRSLADVDLAENIFSLSFLGDNANVIHFIHTEMLHFPALISQKIVVIVAPYHASWLEQQHLDIFIPSLNIAIEFQGKQHYEPVEFFGGKEGFAMRQQLDAIKREKCASNGIGLVEWNYRTPINDINFIYALNNQ